QSWTGGAASESAASGSCTGRRARRSTSPRSAPVRRSISKRRGWLVERGADGSPDGQVRARQDLVHLEHVRAREHAGRWPVPVGLGEIGALRPRHEIVEAAPPGFHPLVPLPLRLFRPPPVLVV